MSDKNESIEQMEQKESGNSGGSQGSKEILEYNCYIRGEFVLFNIVKQHPDVERFLDTQSGGRWVDPINGARVGLGEMHPEVIISGKTGVALDIRLDGSENQTAIKRGHTDRTRCSLMPNNRHAQGVRDLIISTLSHFGAKVREFQKSEDKVKVVTAERLTTIKV